MISGQGETSSQSPVTLSFLFLGTKLAAWKTKLFVPQLRMQLKMQMHERVHIMLMSLKVHMKNQNLPFKGGTS